MTDLPEPDDRTGLYWPESAEYVPSIRIRDDTAAKASGYSTDHHWYAPNGDYRPSTWAELLALCDVEPRLVADAITFTIPDRFTTTNGDTP